MTVHSVITDGRGHRRGCQEENEPGFRESSGRVGATPTDRMGAAAGRVAEPSCQAEEPTCPASTAWLRAVSGGYPVDRNRRQPRPAPGRSESKLTVMVTAVR